MEQTNQFTIPVTAWGDFLAKLAKLNKRAKKLGCDPITFSRGRDPWQPVMRPTSLAEARTALNARDSQRPGTLAN